MYKIYRFVNSKCTFQLRLPHLSDLTFLSLCLSKTCACENIIISSQSRTNMIFRRVLQISDKAKLKPMLKSFNNLSMCDC